VQTSIDLSKPAQPAPFFDGTGTLGTGGRFVLGLLGLALVGGLMAFSLANAEGVEAAIPALAERPSEATAALDASIADARDAASRIARQAGTADH
jgi:hypothetical protein